VLATRNREMVYRSKLTRRGKKP